MQRQRSRAERKEYLRGILEPYLRQSVDNMFAELLAEERYLDRGTIAQIMLSNFPDSLFTEAAKNGLDQNTWQREDIELLVELAKELTETIKQEAMH